MNKNRTVRSQPDEESGPYLTEEDLKESRRMIFILTTIATSVFMAFVYIFGTYGGELVNSVSNRMGDHDVIRAKNLAEAGMLSEAIDLYREALKKQLDTDESYIWARRGFATALIETGQLEEAFIEATQILGLYPVQTSDWVARETFQIVMEAAVESTDVQTRIRWCDAWCAAAKSTSNERALEQGMYWKERVHISAGNSSQDDAL